MGAIGPYVSAMTINDNNIKIYINNELTQVDPKPFIQDGRTYVPIRFIAENFGASVDWEENEKRVTIIFGRSNQQNKVIHLSIDNKQATVNGESITLDAVPMIINGRTVVPLRFLIENFGLNIAWDDSTSSVFVSSAEMGKTVPPSGDFIEPTKSIVLEHGTKIDINLLDGWKYKEGGLTSSGVEVVFLLEHESGATFNIGVEKLDKPIGKELYIELTKNYIAKLFHTKEIEENDLGPLYGLSYTTEQSGIDAYASQILMFPYMTDNNMIERLVEVQTLVLPLDLSEQQCNKLMDEVSKMVEVKGDV